jgi:hypothetical protein
MPTYDSNPNFIGFNGSASPDRMSHSKDPRRDFEDKVKEVEDVKQLEIDLKGLHDKIFEVQT